VACTVVVLPPLQEEPVIPLPPLVLLLEDDELLDDELLDDELPPGVAEAVFELIQTLSLLRRALIQK
jgi:hypothetical protein